MISANAGEMIRGPVRTGWAAGWFVGAAVVTSLFVATTPLVATATLLLTVAGCATVLLTSAFSVSQAMTKAAAANVKAVFRAMPRETFMPV